MTDAELIGILIPLGLSCNVSTGLLGVSCAVNAIGQRIPNIQGAGIGQHPASVDFQQRAGAIVLDRTVAGQRVVVGERPAGLIGKCAAVAIGQRAPVLQIASVLQPAGGFVFQHGSGVIDSVPVFVSVSSLVNVPPL